MGSAGDTHTLNARVLRFRADPEREDPRALAEDLLSAKRYSDARAVVASAQSADVELNAALTVLEGRAWYLDGDASRAQASFLKVVKLDPQCAEAFRWLGMVLYERDDMARAVRAFERALELDPRDAEARRLLNLSQMAQPLGDSNPPLPAAPAPERTAGAAGLPRPGTIRNPVAPPPGTLRMPVAPPALEVPGASEERSGTPSGRPPLLRSPSHPPPAEPPPERPQSRPEFEAASRPLRASREGSRPGLPASEPASTSSATARRAGSRSEGQGVPAPGRAQSSPELQGARPTGRAVSRPEVAAPASSRAPSRPELPGAHNAQPPPRSESQGAPTPARVPSRPELQGAPPASRASSRPEFQAFSRGSRSLRPDGGAHTAPTVPSFAAPVLRDAADALGGAADGTAAARRPSQAVPPRPARALVPEPRRVAEPGGGPEPASRAAAGGAKASEADHAAPGLRRDRTSEDKRDPVPAEAPRVAPQASSRAPVAPAPDRPRTERSPRSERPDRRASQPERNEPVRAQAAGSAAGAAPFAPALDGVDAVLAMLGRQGIFETSEADGARATWAPADQVQRTGTVLRGTLIGIWVAALALTVGGYFGWQAFIQRRHAEAEQLVAQARSAAFEGDYRKLVDAERLLEQARELYPRSQDVLRLQLLVHAQRVLESGSRELSALRITSIRAKQLAVDPAYLTVARAVMAAYSGEGQQRPALEQAQESARGAPELLYLIGRLEQRLDHRDAAQARLSAAAAAAPDMLAAAVAMAELQQQSGHDSDALASFETVLKRRPGHVRAQLWRAYLGAPERDISAGLDELDGLAKLARAGTASERVLWSLARARLLARKGQRNDAVATLREALTAGGGEPHLLATLADQARGMGQLGIAQQAATLAVSAAPAAGAYRMLLASILIERHEGGHALVLLGDVPAAQPGIAALRARAALQTGEPEALKAALGPLEAQLAVHRTDPEAQALRLRLSAAIDPNPKVLAEAKAAQRRAPSNAHLLRALGEVALAVRSPSDASAALKQLTTATPADPEAFYLLGRARRMAGDASGAESSLRRAVVLSPAYADALAALGALLLDTGDYARAQAVYEEALAQSPVSARLGLVEALIGQGRLDDAKTQLDGIPDPAREGLAVRETSARFWIAKGSPKQAVALLSPVADGADRAGTLALYGDALLFADQAKSAAAVYDRALAIDATLPEALIGRAEVHMRGGAGKEAVALLSRAKQELESRLRPPELRARALGLLGIASLERAKKKEVQAARELLQRALELDPDGRYASRIKRALEP